jgi:hypothetical protein
MWPLTSGTNMLTTAGLTEDVHASDDEHVVGAADAADARALAAALARARSHLNVVSRAEA